MKISLNFCKLLMIIFFISSLGFAQRTRSGAMLYRPYQILKEGIDVSVIIDSFCQKWGVKIERLEEAAKLGVRSAGWEYNQSSDKCLTISVDSVYKQDDFVSIFAIKWNELQQNVDVKKDDSEFLAISIHQFVRNIADKLRKQIFYENIYKLDPEDIPNDINCEFFQE